MPDEALTQPLRDLLFADTDRIVYVILDGASAEGLVRQLYQLAPEWNCLYSGDLAPDMAEVAPYLVRLEPDHPFTDWVLEKGWGEHWGIFALTDADIRPLRRHCRTFTMVRDPDGKILYFRYYDPRVFRVYLPVCNAQEMEAVFGPIGAYVFEDEDPRILLRFTRGDGQPRREKIALVDGVEIAAP